MAPKKPSRVLDDPVSASPSRDHEEEEEELEEEEGLELCQVAVSEEKENEFSLKTPQIAKLSQRSKSRSGGESSKEEEGSDTDDGNARNSPTASSFAVKPSVNKDSHSMEPTKPTAKRALIDGKGRKDVSKKTKVAKDQHTEQDKEGTAKKAGSASGRVFSPADEIALLGGMIDYQKEKGADPHADMGALLEFVKGCFLFEITRSQLYEKIRRLKKKFFANLGKGEKFIATKPLDQECFELSKKIWGGNNVTSIVGYSGRDSNDRVVGNGVDHTETVKIVDGVSIKKKSAKGKSSEGKRKEKSEKRKKESRKKNNNKKKKKLDAGPKIVQEEAEPGTNGDVMIDKEDVGKDDEGVMKEIEGAWNDDENIVKDGEQNIQLKYPNLIASLSMDMPDSQRKIMMEGICLVDGEKARALDDCWRELQIEEIEFHCRKLELMAEHSRLLMNAWKKKR